jgi:hypothetical protein
MLLFANLTWVLGVIGWFAIRYKSLDDRDFWR